MLYSRLVVRALVLAVTAVSSILCAFLTDDLVNLYKVRMELLDKLTRGSILLRIALRNRMYTHGSRIWFHVAKRIHSNRYLICS